MRRQGRGEGVLGAPGLAAKLANATEEQQGLLLQQLGEALRALVHEHGTTRLERYRGLQVSLSMGAAQWRKGESVAALIGRADAALYEAKHAGRNRVLRAA